MTPIQLFEPTVQPAVLTLSSSDQSQRVELLNMFSGDQFADFSLDNSCDFEVVVRRIQSKEDVRIRSEGECKRSNGIDRENRNQWLEQALLMTFRDVEAMVKKTASNFGGWSELDFLSELNDQLDYLQNEESSVFELDVIFNLAKEMYLCCPADIAPQFKKHVLICNQFLILAHDKNAKAS